VSDQGQAPYYVARIEPLAPASAAKDTAEQKGLAFYVAMDGQVTAKELPQTPHRVRVIKSN
jgi:hypothetical protein